jgi:hypothetical protein
VGADQHIEDPDDRADLVVRAYELYGEYRSLSRVREELADDPVTLRVCGARRLFARATISEWIEEGRKAEAAAYLYELAAQRADSDTRLSLLAAVAWDHLKIRNGGELPTEDLLAVLEFMRKIEHERIDLLGLKVPVTAKVEINNGSAEIPDNIRAAVAAARRRAIEQGRALVDDAYPGATVVPTPTRPRRDRRTS